MIKKILKIVNMPMKLYVLRQLKCFFYMILYSFSSLVFPGLISYIIDDGIMVGDILRTILYCIFMLIIGVIMVVFQYLSQMNFNELSKEIILELKEKIYCVLLNKNMKFWSNNTPGDMYTVLENDVNKLETLITTMVGDVIINLITAIGISLYLMWADIWMGIGILLLSVIFAYMQRKMGNLSEKSMENLRTKISILSSFTDESVNNMLNMQVAGYSDYMKKTYDMQNKSMIYELMYQIKLVVMMRGIGGAFNILGILAVLIIGTIRIKQDIISVGVLFSLTVYVQRLYSPIVGLGMAYINVRNSKPILRKISSIFDDENNITSGSYVPDTGVINGKIELKNITFGYEEGQIIFRNFNMKIRANTIIGIVGENGSGKSTLIHLMMKLVVPASGEILIDGKKLEDYNTEFLRKQIGYMQQNEFFFKGKLRLILDPNSRIHSKDLIRLMELFRIPIEQFENGLDTEIGENMINLSGGEIQKLALVRLFCENKQVYILDEPTAALDIRSEEELVLLLKKILKEKTAVIVTHRRKILEICDNVIHI